LSPCQAQKVSGICDEAISGLSIQVKVSLNIFHDVGFITSLIKSGLTEIQFDINSSNIQSLKEVVLKL
jgi:hypothetical protein